ncbi:hypothetical protein AB0H57_14295 [Micromonospora sp. NPDC050686]|uniref:hypothetical protein n=1 Tax=Micromonospora sp. NPDC050686 TaxID=3154631 RepID=UPI0033C29F45
MKLRWVAAAGVAVAVIVVAVAVGVVTALGSAPEEQSPAPSSTGADPGTTSTRLPVPDDSYWDPARMASAQPAPMPTD